MQAELATTAELGTSALVIPAAIPNTGTNLWKKILSFPVLLAIGLGAAIFLLDSGSIADPDIWWHLRNAEVLVQSHSVVHHDFYSFTATGSRWINEAWLSELPIIWDGNGLVSAASILSCWVK